MLKIRLEDVTKYFSHIMKQYVLLQANLAQDECNSHIQVKYKITNSYEEYKKTGKLLIQSRQGSAYSHMTPEEIYGDKFIMSHLHPMDVSLLTKLFFETKTKNDCVLKYQILKQEFSEKDEKVTYTIYDPENEATLKVNGDELLESQEILKRLSGVDGVSLGFDLGVKHVNELRSKLQ